MNAWDKSTWYRAGDIVTHNGWVWQCLNDHRSGEPGNCGEILWRATGTHAECDPLQATMAALTQGQASPL